MFLSARTLVPVQSLAEAGFFSRPVRLRGRLRLTNLDTRQLSGSWLGKLGGEVGSWPRHLIRSWPRKCEGLRLHTSTALPAMGTPLPFFFNTFINKGVWGGATIHCFTLVWTGVLLTHTHIHTSTRSHTHDTKSQHPFQESKWTKGETLFSEWRIGHNGLSDASNPGSNLDWDTIDTFKWKVECNVKWSMKTNDSGHPPPLSPPPLPHPRSLGGGSNAESSQTRAINSLELCAP